MLEDKIKKLFKKKQKLDIREFRTGITNIRITKNEAKQLTKDMKQQGLIEYNKKHVLLRKRRKH